MLVRYLLWLQFTIVFAIDMGFIHLLLKPLKDSDWNVSLHHILQQLVQLGIIWGRPTMVWLL